MITIFNRRKLVDVFELTMQARIRDVLVANGIDYLLNIRPFVGGYRIWVKKTDYELAKHVIQDAFRFSYATR
ncbi:MAG: hypothetical protein IJO50_03960 [Clostridia bacterium]|nr:hypothetical protein [Clostridia bacterium]